MSFDIYRARRSRVLDAMAARGGGVAIQPTAPERLRNRDSEYPFRFDSHFFYLSGFTEPESVLALIAHGDRRQSILFCRDKNEEREIWEGHRHGPDAARELFGFDAAFSIGQLDEQMPKLIADSPALFYPLGSDASLDSQVQRWLSAVRAAARSGLRAPAQAIDLHTIVDEMRLVKDASEIATMRRAGAISAAAHVRAMRRCKPGLREYHLEAELLHEFRSRGAQAPAYNAIVAAGANACVLHYRAGDEELCAGELCLIDAGCEVDGYAADVTRTFPVDGCFSAVQRDVYDVVLAAQHAAFAQVRPGNGFNAPHDAAVRSLAQGLLDLGLVTGSLDAVLESGAYRQFYMHRTGHWLGLDVHDVGDYRAPAEIAAGGSERPWRVLAEGMVLTVEPGLYLRPAENVPAQLHNIGVRIEDDVLVTADGCAVLTAAAPTAAADIEALMRG
ncbi:MAG TPA: aminopeptidase P N-terminal domain-containing protein [Burkholderiaceae bacterium]|nr:aminopeptidase P N-terminal domain-containing protein [Burkholderiaceae bacterium]